MFRCLVSAQKNELPFSVQNPKESHDKGKREVLQQSSDCTGEPKPLTPLSMQYSHFPTVNILRIFSARAARGGMGA